MSKAFNLKGYHFPEVGTRTTASTVNSARPSVPSSPSSRSRRRRRPKLDATGANGEADGNKETGSRTDDGEDGLTKQAVLTGTYFMNGDEACAEARSPRAAGFSRATRSRRHRDRRADERAAAEVGGSIFRWRTSSPRWPPSSARVGPGQDHDQHLRPRLLADDGNIGLGLCTETPLRGLQRPARRTQHRPAHPGRPGRHDAGQVGFARPYEIIALTPASPRRCSTSPSAPSTSPSSTASRC